MAKKDNDNFDFETEGKAKVSFDLSFLKNLTKKQKGFILAVIAAVVVVAVIVVCIAIGTKNGQSGDDNDDWVSGDIPADGTMPDEITKFYIASMPVKTHYTVGDQADYAGLSVQIKNADDISMIIHYENDPDAFTITGFDSSKPAEQLVITVECQGFTDTFTIDVVSNNIAQTTLVSITVDPLPKTTYKVGESFSHTGGYIVAEYSDGTYQTIKLRMSHVSGFGAIANTPGEHQIKVSYSDDHGGYAETYITITITE